MPLVVRALLAWSALSIVVGPLIGTLLATGGGARRAQLVPAVEPIRAIRA